MLKIKQYLIYLFICLIFTTNQIVKADDFNKSLNEIRAEITSIHEQAHFYQSELPRVTNSRSWRITFPLRYVGKIFRKLKSLLKNFFFDFKNLPFKVFFKNYRVRAARKFVPQLFKITFANKLNSTNSFMSSKEKKYLAVLEKTQKEK